MKIKVDGGVDHMTSNQLITRIRAGMPGDRDVVVVVLVHR